MPHGRSAAESKPRADGQEPNRAGAKRRQPEATPTRRVEVAQHTEGDWYACGGKFGGSAVEQRAITWGDLTGVSDWSERGREGVQGPGQPCGIRPTRKTSGCIFGKPC